jgi:very-short-patch-repair endonuclease
MNNLCECGCGKEVVRQSSRFLRGHSSRTQETKDKNKRSCLQHYGTEYSFQSKEVKEKRKHTCFEKYGYENPMQAEEIKEKFNDTMIKNYGYKNALQSKRCIDKFKKTMINSFGYEHALQSKQLKEKMKLTCLERFSVENPMCSKEVQKKYKQTCRKNLGVDYPTQSEEIKKKIRQGNIEKFGGPAPMCSEYVQEKTRQTYLQKYGIDHFFKTPQGRQNLRIRRIREIAEQISHGNPSMPCIGKIEELCLTELQKYTNYNIIRNDNSFRYVVGRYPDGHILELKLFIQFDERDHFEDKEMTIYKEDDINCTLELASLGYIVFRVSELDWKNNKDKVIYGFQTVIKERELSCVEFLQPIQENQNLICSI